jgi:predicted nucleic acid-binding protein
MPVVISNASPLIGLCSINLLYILKNLWNEIVIPEAVYKEVVINGAGKQGIDIIVNACREWIKVVSVKNRQEVEVLQAILDEGEAEVIALGQELGAGLLLLDNREPRLFAKTINLKVIGTVGIIKLAWQRGLIQDPVKELYKLRLKGFWIHDKLIEQVKSDK